MTTDGNIQLQVEDSDPTAEGIPGNRSLVESPEKPRLPIRWYTVTQASRLLNTSEVAIRKQIAGGNLTAIRIGRGWRVLLPGDLKVGQEPTSSSAEAIQRSPGEQVSLGYESMVALVRELQQQSLAMAGQIGFLQSQLTAAHSELQRLEESNAAEGEAATDVDSSVSLTEHEAVLQKLAILQRIVNVYEQAASPRHDSQKRRRWWRWRST